MANLYHASQVKNLKVMSPKSTISNDRYIGDFVFATKNRLMAMMYLVPKGIPTLMNPDDTDKNIVICSEIEAFLAIDKGGAIYELPDKDFVKTPQKGLSNFEMVSLKPVIPIKVEVINSSLQAMKSSGIEIRFVNRKVFSSLINNPKQRQLIKSIEPYIPS